MVVSKSMASEWTTEKVDVSGFDMGTIQAVWTGANTAKAKLVPQMSVDGVNWLNLFSDSSIKKADTAAGTLSYTLSTVEYPWLRCCFDNVNNTAGTITIYAFLKRRWSPNR